MIYFGRSHLFTFFLVEVQGAGAYRFRTLQTGVATLQTSCNFHTGCDSQKRLHLSMKFKWATTWFQTVKYDKHQINDSVSCLFSRIAIPYLFAKIVKMV